MTATLGTQLAAGDDDADQRQGRKTPTHSVVMAIERRSKVHELRRVAGQS